MNPILRNLALGAGIAGVLWFLFVNTNRRTPDQIAEDRRLGFEDAGVIGDLGASVNRASGGFFANIGRAVGDFLDPVNRKTLDELTAPTVNDNPNQL